jgi:hypothetical protein
MAVGWGRKIMKGRARVPLTLHDNFGCGLVVRPAGRFDRQVSVDTPDQKGRLEILKVHARNKKFDADIDLKEIALRTPGFSGEAPHGASTRAARSRRPEELVWGNGHWKDLVPAIPCTGQAGAMWLPPCS